MLVLNRKEDERVIIANEIAVQVIRIGRDTVKLGIEAPSHIKVHRDEIRGNIARESPRDVQPQIPPKDVLDAIGRVGDLAQKLGMPTTEFLDDLIRRFHAGRDDQGADRGAL